MIYTVTLNAALDKTVTMEGFRVGEVNRLASLRTDPGGKGINVAKVLCALKTPCLAMGILGGAAGDAIAAALDRAGVRGDFVRDLGETRTNLKLIDTLNHTNTDINEPGSPIEAPTLARVLEKLLDRVKPGDFVVLSGSLPPGAPSATYRDWTAALKEAGARVCLDADGEAFRFAVEAAPYLVKPNREELAGFAGRPLSSLRETAEAARELIRRGVAYGAVSMGGQGALFVSGDSVLLGHGLQVPVGSTVGAGDSMLAALVAALARGESMEKAAAFSIAVSAANVMCSGTQAAGLEAVEALLPRVRVERLNL